MVMPCSRSASSPSTSSAKSISSPVVPNFLESFSSDASVSSNSNLVSYSKRPISVDLPSSTLPQVRKRSSDFFSWAARNFWRSVEGACCPAKVRALIPEPQGRIFSSRTRARAGRPFAVAHGPLEVPLLLLLLHRSLFVAVDQPALALRGAGGEHFRDDVFQTVGTAFNRAGQGIAAQGAEAHQP